MKINQNTFKASLNKEIEDQLLKYFNEIYEVDDLGQHEFNMIYLAWLIDKGYVSYKLGELFFDKEEVELKEEDYEISFEGESGAGFNYELLDSYYMFDRIAEILKAQSINKKI